MPKGGWRETARGKVGRKPIYFRPTLPIFSKKVLTMIAWGRYDRPTTEDEIIAVLVAIIEEEADRVAAEEERNIVNHYQKDFSS